MQICLVVQFFAFTIKNHFVLEVSWVFDFKVGVPNSIPNLAHMYLSGLWLGVAFNNGYKKDKCLREIGVRAPY